MQIFGPIQNGWYDVQVNNTRGWIFGSFVLPADEGYWVGITNNRNPAVLLNVDGSLSGVENQSGNKVLVTGQTDDLYQILTPEGLTLYVSASSVSILS